MKNSKAKKGYKAPFIKVLAKKSLLEAKLDKRDKVIGSKSAFEFKSKKSNNKRDGLLRQFMALNKSSVIEDTRFGERREIEEETQIAHRIAIEKSKQFKEKTIFNLNDEDDEMLTHKGELINNVERYEDPRDLSDSDDELLNKDFVEKAHFGGFMRLKNTNEVSDISEKSKKEIIEELILASKQKKLEKSKQEDAYFEKVTSLNKMYGEDDFMKLVNNSVAPTKKKKLEDLLNNLEGNVISHTEKNTPVAVAESKEKYDDFNKIIRELKFESKPAVAKINIQPLLSSGLEESLNVSKETSSLISSLSMPKSYEEYLSLLKKNCFNNSENTYDRDSFLLFHHTIIDNHVSTQKPKLLEFLRFILKLLSEDADKSDILSLEYIFAYLPHIILRIANVNQCLVADIFNEEIIQKQAQFSHLSKKKLKNSYVVLLGLISQVFENKDVRHRVLTPSLLFLLQILNEFRFSDSYNARKVLQLCYQAYNIVKNKKSYCPEIIKCLYSIFNLFLENNIKKKDDSAYQYNISLSSSDLEDIIIPTIDLTRKFIKLYSHFPTANLIFKPIREVLNEISSKTLKHCVEFSASYSESTFRNEIKEILLSLNFLTEEREKYHLKPLPPKILKLYEPQFEETFTMRKRRGTRDEQDRARLKHIIKKEKKGAIRDLKQDSNYLARAIHRQQMHSDAIRKQKVNKLIGSLSNQEGDYQKFQKVKKQ